jgi:hypothetical protein
MQMVQKFMCLSPIYLISRYSGGDPDLAPLHKLGTDTWSKAKRKALEQIHDVAAELLHIQARRQSKPGFAFELDHTGYMQFSSGFAYEETLTKPMRLKQPSMICNLPNQWIVWSVVMSVLVKLKWRCEQLLLQYKTTNKLRY